MMFFTPGTAAFPAGSADVVDRTCADISTAAEETPPILSTA
jgi:hypothetical protein